MLRGMSLARKCLLVFGGAIMLIVLAALWAPWLRMTDLVDAGQAELSRQMVDTWERLGEQAGPQPEPVVTTAAPIEERAGIGARRLSVEQARALADEDAFVGRALDQFREDPDLTEVQEARFSGTTRQYRYAKCHRRRAQGDSVITEIIVLERRSIEAWRLLATNTAFLAISGLGVMLMALLVFYVITQRLIIGPVGALREAAERVREGNLAVRSGVRTGDEFEQLSDTLNSMLTDMQAQQDRLRAINTAMDLKLHELAEANMSLHQAAKVKGEFLANVSHELRTPLNSINGFAELLLEAAKNEAANPGTQTNVAKRTKYLENILTAGRGLLALINSLLEMARVEARKVELRLERVNLRDACEGLLGLIAPLADHKGVQLKLEVPEDMPLITTDGKRLQQIVFNFLSNAVKFVEPAEKTGRTPTVTLRAERLVATDAGADELVRISVIDNGPGIPSEDHQRVFEKFYQRDATHTREQGGTGLGLAISKELATMLGGEIQVESEVGRGAMFSVILPMVCPEPNQPAPAPAA
ncbi:MAG: HAMP domain-containing histidine kinase [Phycisphaerales bacterium]|nr:HAMP domain-containing histidine kinase [Phycisphaerales bacterium]